MRGAGEAERRFAELCVDTLGRTGICVDGVMLELGGSRGLRLAVLTGLFGSGDLCCDRVGDLLLLALELGERALFDVSLIQFLKVAR